MLNAGDIYEPQLNSRHPIDCEKPNNINEHDSHGPWLNLCEGELASTLLGCGTLRLIDAESFENECC